MGTLSRSLLRYAQHRPGACILPVLKGASNRPLTNFATYPPKSQTMSPSRLPNNPQRAIPPPRRKLSTTPSLFHGHIDPPAPGEESLSVTFLLKDSTPHTVSVRPGTNLLDIAQSEDLDMEGACGGSCACSTCHIIVEDQDLYDKMPEPDDDENDMLDLAFGLTETSRLGCQVKMEKGLDGLRVRLPSMTRNLQASDFQGEGKKGGG